MQDLDFNDNRLSRHKYIHIENIKELLTNILNEIDIKDIKQ